MVSDFLRWVSKEDLKNQKIIKILITSINSMIPEFTAFDAFQMMKTDFMFSKSIKNPKVGAKFLDFEIKKECPFEDGGFFIQMFRLYEEGSIFPSGISRFETKDGVFEFAIIQR